MSTIRSTMRSRTTPPTYTRHQNRVLDALERQFRAKHVIAARNRMLIGICVTATCLWMGPRISPLALLSGIITFTCFQLDSQVFAASSSWPRGAYGIIWWRQFPFIWVEYRRADGPPAVPALIKPTVRWWGQL